MMKARVMSLCFAGLSLVIAAACSVPPPAADAPRPALRTSENYVLTQGQTITLAPATTLKLERINDSRCKAGAVCVWAGHISYRFVLNDKQGETSFVLAEDMPGATKSVARKGLVFTLQGLEPAEPPPLKAPPPDYRVSLRVNIAQPI
jgi:hypothetical protein